jgi:hypothetical protein
MLLSGILSLLWSPLSSRPPDVEVPLPLRLGLIALSVVGDAPLVDELAAGSPAVDPRPLGAPAFCAWAQEMPRAQANARTIVGFIAKSSQISMKPIGQRRECSLTRPRLASDAPIMRCAS